MSENNNIAPAPSITKNYKPAIIAVAVMLGIVLAGLIWYSAETRANKWELKQDSLTIECTDIYEPAITDVVDIDKYPDVTSDNTEVWVKDVVKDFTSGCIVAGEYEVVVEHKCTYSLFGMTVMVKPSTKKMILNVVDTNAPKWDAAPDEITFIKGSNEDLKSKFVASDMTKVTITVDDSNVNYNEIGTYEATVFAVDESGNKNKHKVTVVIVTPKIEISAKQLIVDVGKTGRLTATTDGKDKTITWTSSDPAVATVREGIVTANKAGTVQIVAAANGVSVSCEVIVKDNTTTKPKVMVEEETTSAKDAKKDKKKSDASDKKKASETTTEATEPTPDYSRSCVDGGAAHSISEGEGWYNSYAEAAKAAEKHISKLGGTGSYKVQQCEYCKRYTFTVKMN